MANKFDNLHNVKKAGSEIVNIFGQHASFHLQYDAPLSGDIEGVAKPMSHWVRTSGSATTVARDSALAIAVVRSTPNRIAALSLPADASWGVAGPAAAPEVPAAALPPGPVAVEAVLAALRAGGSTVILLGGAALRGNSLEWAGRIVVSAGRTLMCQGQNARIERGAGRVGVRATVLWRHHRNSHVGGVQNLVLVGAKTPVASFAYPNQPSLLVPS